MPDTPAPPFAVQRLDHVVLRVRDVERAVDFYQRVLGCRVARRNPGAGLVHLRAGASMIDLVALDGPIGLQGGAGPGAQGRNVDHFCLRVEPFDEAALRAHLARHDVACSTHAKPLFGAEGTGPAVYLHDPDGNTVELKGPAHADRPGDAPADGGTA